MEKNDNIVVDLEHEKDNLEGSLENLETQHYSHSEHHSSHSHHHSHHHHSNKHKRHHHNTKKEKAKRFLKHYKYRIANIFVAILFVCILVVLGVSLDKRSYQDENGSSAVSDGINETESTLQIEIPIFEDEISVAGPAVEEYLSSDASVSATSIYKKYSALGNLDRGLPVTISYNMKGLPNGCIVLNSEVQISENSNLTSPRIYMIPSGETSVDIYNLKSNTKYYYQINLTLSNGTKTGIEGSFKTADTPRMLFVDGIGNIRDIGGWKTADGKRIKQGLLYRSTEIDGAVNSKYKITADGVNTMLTVLGIRYEMDLRPSTDNPSGADSLGAGVKHTYYNAPMYSNAFTDSGKKSIQKIFSDLSDKNNYPVLLHCTHGMDRTGTVCYLLEALLGVAEEDLMREYQLSAFYHGSLWSLNDMNEFIGRLKAYEGSTVQEKAENYLLSIGVTAQEISSIREIYLEK